MFISTTAADRQQFFAPMDGCLIPGYTGYCPLLKFRFGKCYGTSTKEIIKELTDRGVLHRPLALTVPVVNTRTDGAPSTTATGLGDCTFRGGAGPGGRVRPYVLGYTGFIPGLTFRYGTSYRRAADASMAELRRRSNTENERKEAEKPTSLPSALRLPKKAQPDDQQQVPAPQVTEFREPYKDSHVSVELPPIAGYTGHIPHFCEASLSQRYRTAATRGLRILRESRTNRGSMEATERAIRDALSATSAPRTVQAC